MPLDASLAESLSVVVPAYNEEAGIAVTLHGLVNACPGAEIIVVDDASTDGTAREVAAFPGVRLARHRYNRGQGRALKTGMQLATRPYVAWFDADNEHRTDDLARLVQRIAAEDLVAVIGQRTTPSATFVRAAGKSLIRLMGRQLKIDAGSDLNCGLRVFRREVILDYLPLVSDRFSASMGTTLILLERRYPIAFEAITINPRIGTSTVRMRDGFEAILILLRAVLLFAPMRVFLPLGLWFATIGVIYGLTVAIIHRAGFPVAGMLLVIMGALIVMLGLIADQISQLRLSALPERNLLAAPVDRGDDEP